MAASPPSPFFVTLNDLELTGRTRTHLDQHEALRFAAHPAATAAFLAMRDAARDAGIDLVPVSVFRDFAAQMKIWNDKFEGRRPLYDCHGRQCDPAALDEDGIIAAILAWSALPGASRHHWGTDFDVIDAAAVPEDYRIDLLPHEFGEGGPFHALHGWLDAHMSDYGFFRPYARAQGGVSPEPWHLSYAPIADCALKCLTPELLASVLADAPILGKARLLETLLSIYTTYVLNIAAPDPQALLHRPPEQTRQERPPYRPTE